PAARVGGVDDIVDLAVGRHRESSPALVGRRNSRLEGLLALRVVPDLFELAPHPELDRTLQAHRAELRRGPADREERSLEPAAGHRLRAKPVALAEDDGAGR